MTTAQHTPGPWAVDPNDGQWITADCDGLIVAEIPYGDDRHHEVNDANARLIAIAPELLETLRQIANGQTMQGEFTHAQTVLAYQELARKAVAKVEGAQ